MNVKKESKKKGQFIMEGLKAIAISAFIIITVNGTAAAGGLFGPLQTVSKEAGGLHTGIGYERQEDKYKKEWHRTRNQTKSSLFIVRLWSSKLGNIWANRGIRFENLRRLQFYPGFNYDFQK